MTCRCGDQWHAIECDCPTPADEATRARHSGAGQSAPGDAPATPAAQNRPRAPTPALKRPWGALTIDEAAAWRTGWAAAQDAAGAKLRDMACRMREVGLLTSEDIATAAALDAAAAAVARIAMPAPMHEPTGLEFRGG